MDQNRNRKEEVLSEAMIGAITSIPEPPPLKFISPFKTIEEWLIHICDTNNTNQIIQECYITFMKLSWGNVLSLEGWSTIEDKNTISHLIVFKPISNINFPLPSDKYGNLSDQSLNEQVVKELIEFTNSNKFKNSFFEKVKSIHTNVNGEIWSKK